MERKPYIIACGERGAALVFGFADKQPVAGENCVLHDARMVIRFTEQGVFGLAKNGPRPSDRIAGAVESVGTGIVRQWLAMSEQAADAVVAHPEWAG